MEQAFPQGDQDGWIDYDHLAAAYAQHRRIHPKVLRKLVEAAGASGSDPVLEIGCGSGNYIAAVQSATGCRCFGVDPSARMLDAARGQNPEVSFQVGRGEQLPFADSAFGLAFSVDVIHHVAARADFYAEAWRVLRAGGTVGTVTESEDMIRRRLHSHYFPDTIAIELRRYPSIAELTALMRQTRTPPPVSTPYYTPDKASRSRRAGSAFFCILQVVMQKTGIFSHVLASDRTHLQMSAERCKLLSEMGFGTFWRSRSTRLLTGLFQVRVLVGELNEP
jgi:ubiquinone/menaquinone biosynthesis C-methylase UbiE